MSYWINATQQLCSWTSAAKPPDKQEQLRSLEVKILEGEVCLHDASSFDSGSQHVLLGGNVGAAGYPVQVVQVTVGGARSPHNRDQVSRSEDEELFWCTCWSGRLTKRPSR